MYLQNRGIMWVKTYTKTYLGVTKESIWRIWADVNNWPKWDKELEYCKMKGEFIQGTPFILKPKGGPKVKITLSEVIPEVKFTDYCKFLGATMFDEHMLEDIEGGVCISNTIRVQGLLSFIWVRLVAKKVANAVPIQLDALVELARSQ